MNVAVVVAVVLMVVKVMVSIAVVAMMAMVAMVVGSPWAVVVGHSTWPSGYARNRSRSWVLWVRVESTTISVYNLGGAGTVQIQRCHTRCSTFRYQHTFREAS